MDASCKGDKTKMLTNYPLNNKCIIMWSLKNGSEITRTTRDKGVLSFAWSRDGKLLAISHQSSGRIAIVDVVDGFRTLGQTNLQNVCGVTRFSPDNRSLLYCHFALDGLWSTFRLNINISEQFSCRVDVVEEPFVTWEFESRSEGGFLLGDPFPCVSEKEKPVKCGFVLDKHTLLRSDSDRVDMLNINEQQQNEKEAAHTIVVQIAFSLSDEAIYVVSRHDNLLTTVTAWNVSSSKWIPKKEGNVSRSSRNCLAVVKGGVLIITEKFALQMWNFELSKCIWCCTNIGSVTGVFPVSEERVACTTEERKVIILDSTSRKILSTIQIGRNTNLLACNSKFQILTRSEDGSLRLSDRKTTLWEKKLQRSRCERFSPAETFVISIINQLIETVIYVLDAFSGETLHVFVSGSVSRFYSNCEFVSDEECVVICGDHSNLRVVQLFNVKSGDLLSNLQPSKLLSDTFLAASPCKGLVAISSSDSEHGYELIQVRVPGDEESRRSKWTLNPEVHRKVQEGEQEVCSCVSKYCSELQDRLRKLQTENWYRLRKLQSENRERLRERQTEYQEYFYLRMWQTENQERLRELQTEYEDHLKKLQTENQELQRVQETENRDYLRKLQTVLQRLRELQTEYQDRLRKQQTENQELQRKLETKKRGFLRMETRRQDRLRKWQTENQKLQRILETHYREILRDLQTENQELLIVQTVLQELLRVQTVLQGLLRMQTRRQIADSTDIDDNDDDDDDDDND